VSKRTARQRTAAASRRLLVLLRDAHPERTKSTPAAGKKKPASTRGAAPAKSEKQYEGLQRTALAVK
jgi:hypothetical protein